MILEQYSYIISRIKAVQCVGKRGVAIVGDPGIGKSMFLLYVLIQNLCASRPIIWDDGHLIHVFTRQGLYSIVGDASIFERSVYRGVLVLVDIKNQDKMSVFIEINGRPFIIQVASPKPQRYHGLLKQRDGIMLLMPPSSREELVQLLNLHKFEKLPDQSAILNVIEMYGTSTLNLYDILGGIYPVDGIPVDDELSKLTTEDLSFLFRQSSNSAREYSHWIVTSIQSHSARLPDSPAHDLMVYAVRTPYIWKKLCQHIQINHIVSLRTLYSQLHASPILAVSRGWMFEGLCNEILADGGERLIGANGGSKWKACAWSGYNYNFFYQNACCLFMHPRRVWPKHGTLQSSMFPQKGTIPPLIRFCIKMTVDVQMTVARQHSLKEKGLSLLNGRLQSCKAKLFVFVIPQGSEFQAPAPEAKWLTQFEFYLLEVDLTRSKYDIQRFSLDEAVDRMDDGDPLPPDDMDIDSTG
ncbi:hypothetical protein BT96DRAFT_693349 [Gymnopus androsaceus JB14]|uniref:Uncharacterized protein n=1 Tax=Gymnopus androsaceus JB14 TaxID=1447944 RepID=A0A6A4HQK1_9AGAR|nr:hypothetical protein BT96DRAFT_693349 [Gymnopus androsaceus JB14]